jgi:hypothetical protein
LNDNFGCKRYLLHPAVVTDNEKQEVSEMTYKKPELVAFAGNQHALAMSCSGKYHLCHSDAPACHHGPIRR